MANKTYGDWLGRFFNKMLNAFVRPTSFTVCYPHTVLASLKAGVPTCYAQFKRSVSSTTHKRVNVYQVVFGRGFFYKFVRSDGFVVDKTNFTDVFAESHALFMGAYWHEVGHLLFTDMECDAFFKYENKNPGHIQNLHPIFNIFEDIIIENFGLKLKYPRSRKWLEGLQRIVFEDDSQYKDDGTGGMFMFFLLHKMRKGKACTLTNTFYSAHQADVNDWLGRFFRETSSTARYELTIQFYEWILSKGLQFPEPSPQLTGTSIGSPSSQGQSTGKGGKPASCSGTLETMPGNIPGGMQGAGGGLPNGADDEDDEGGSDNNYSACESSDNDPFDMTGELDQAASEVFNDTPFDNHVFIDLEGGETELKDPQLIETFIEETLSRRADLITDVKESIALFDAEARGRYVAGQSSGDRVSVYDYMRGSFNCFKKRIGQQRQKDLAVSLLIDNSGSMSGDKSVIATQSLVILGQVMHELEIPWEAHSFTTGWFDGDHSDYSGHGKLSYVLKRFDQTWDNAKKWFGVANSALLSA